MISHVSEASIKTPHQRIYLHLFHELKEIRSARRSLEASAGEKKLEKENVLYAFEMSVMLSYRSLFLKAF